MKAPSTKATVGGIAALGTSVASGYGISELATPVPNELTIGFQLKKTNYTVKQNDSTCDSYLSTRFRGIDSNYKKAFEVCIGKSDLKTFAQNSWSLTLLNQSKTESDEGANTDKTILEEKVKIYQDLWTDPKAKTWKDLIDFCIEKGNLHFSDKSFNDLIWNKYVRSCFKKDDQSKYTSALDKSFWTQKPISIETKLVLSNFRLLENDSDREYVADAILKSSSVTEKSKQEKSKELKRSCDSLLKENYSSANMNKYKQAAKECTKLITFDKRADLLNITLHVENDNRQSNWESLKTDFKSFLTNSKTKKTQSNPEKHEDLNKYCKEAKSLSFDKFANNQELEDEWKNLLKFCKRPESLSEDYWTGEKLEANN